MTAEQDAQVQEVHGAGRYGAWSQALTDLAEASAGEHWYNLVLAVPLLKEHHDSVEDVVDDLDPLLLDDPENEIVDREDQQLLSEGLDSLAPDLQAALRLGLKNGVMLDEARLIVEAAEIFPTTERIAAWLVLLVTVA